MGEILIRSYKLEDETQILDLWVECGLVVPQNNPKRDIERKLKINPELFLVGILENKWRDTKAIVAGSITWQYHPITGAGDLLLT
jgi:hypothetical protein